MVKIRGEWFDKKVRIIAVNNKIFTGIVTDVTGKEDNVETNRDSLTIYDGSNYVFISDNEIKDIEILD